MTITPMKHEDRISQKLSRMPKKKQQTIAFDNGSEFSGPGTVRETGPV